MKYAKQRDVNEREIIDALKAVGAAVSQLGDAGVPDLLVWFRGTYHLLEVKRPLGARGGRHHHGNGGEGDLTKAQVKWHAAWPVAIPVVRSPREALIAVGAVIESAPREPGATETEDRNADLPPKSSSQTTKSVDISGEVQIYGPQRSAPRRRCAVKAAISTRGRAKRAAQGKRGPLVASLERDADGLPERMVWSVGAASTAAPEQSSDSWCTPTWLADLIGPVDLDVASNPYSRMDAARSYQLERGEDGLTSPWSGLVWCNGPYSDPLPWCRRLAGHAGPWVALWKLDTTTEWFATLAESGASWAAFRHRLAFDRVDKPPMVANFPSVLVWRDWQPSAALLARLWAPSREPRGVAAPGLFDRLVTP